MTPEEIEEARKAKIRAIMAQISAINARILNLNKNVTSLKKTVKDNISIDDKAYEEGKLLETIKDINNASSILSSVIQKLAKLL